MSAKRAINDTLQCSVATYLRCGEFLNNQNIERLVAECATEKKLKSVNIFQSYKQERDCLVHLACLGLLWARCCGSSRRGSTPAPTVRRSTRISRSRFGSRGATTTHCSVSVAIPTPAISTSSSTGAPYLYHLHASCVNIIVYRCALPVSLARLLHQRHRLQVRLTCITCTPPASTSSSTGAPYLYHLHASCINIIIYRCALPVSLAHFLHQHHHLQVRLTCITCTLPVSTPSSTGVSQIPVSLVYTPSSGVARGWVGWIKSRVPQSYPDNADIVLSPSQNLQVITVHNYLCSMGVLCTSVKLLTDLQIWGCELYKNGFGGWAGL